MKYIFVVVGILLMGVAFVVPRNYAAPDGIWQLIFMELREMKILLWAIAVLLLANILAMSDLADRKNGEAPKTPKGEEGAKARKTYYEVPLANRKAAEARKQAAARKPDDPLAAAHARLQERKQAEAAAETRKEADTPKADDSSESANRHDKIQGGSDN